MDDAVLVGSTLAGRYRIDARVGAGGMGVVWRARDLKLDRDVALKLLSPRMVGDAAARARLVREARAAARLEHPGIVHVYDVGETDGGGAYLVMELVRGESFASRLLDPSFGMAARVRVIVEVARALSFAHREGLVHRDVKPDNVMVRVDGSAVVLDFGVAKTADVARADGELTLTAQGAIVGTPAYLSPEQARAGTVDGRADQWALGVMTYEAVAGRRPWNETSLGALFAAILTEDPPPLTSSLPVSIDAIVRRALSKRPDDRYPDSGAFADALGAVILPGAPLAAPRSASAVDEPFDSAATALASAVRPSPSQELRGLEDSPECLRPLVGRDSEIAVALDLVMREGARLLTLTGPGGTGKTRIAQHVAHRLAPHFADGAWFVSLAEVLEAGLVAPTVVRALGLCPPPDLSPEQALERRLGRSTSLLVLDNFEQVMAASRLVARLQSACPSLCILVTSREPLRIRGEREMGVSPLALPDIGNDLSLEEMRSCTAVQLFLERARIVKRDFEPSLDELRVIAEIVRRLDGLPLAIELAASRMKLLSLGDIRTRLDEGLRLLTGGARDLPSRQQTMRNTIAWSYELLSPDQQALLRRLSTFVGGFTLTAAEAIMNESGALEAIDALFERSLLQREEVETTGETRFRMLETIREYGLERLSEAGELAAAQQAHATIHLALAEEFEAAIRGPDQLRWYRRFDREHPNLRAALDFFEREPPFAEHAQRMAGSLWWFWWRRSHAVEGRARLARALSLGELPGPGRVKSLTGASFLALMMNDATAARALGAAAIAAAESLGAPDLLALALIHGTLMLPAPEAIAQNERALGMFRASGSRWGVATALNYQGEILRGAGQFERARTAYAESREINRAIGNTWVLATSTNNLGVVAEHFGDYAAADDLNAESTEIAAEVGSSYLLDSCLVHLAGALVRRGDWVRAARVLGKSLALRRDSGLEAHGHDRELFERHFEAVKTHLAQEPFAAAMRAGARMGVRELLELSRARA